jgi:hypothetical protein
MRKELAEELEFPGEDREEDDDGIRDVTREIGEESSIEEAKDLWRRFLSGEEPESS